jgi:hypothetical protein
MQVMFPQRIEPRRIAGESHDVARNREVILGA